MKKILSLLFSCVFAMCAISIPVDAALPVGTIEPLWDNTSNVDCTMNFIDGIGYADSVVKAKFGSTSITTDVYVYKQISGEWVCVAELHDTKNKMVSGVSCTFLAEVGGYYKADYTFTVTKSGVDEIINRTLYHTY